DLTQLKQVEEKPIKVERGVQTHSFRYRFPSPGDYVIQVRAANDAQQLDDVRSAVITVKDEVPVLLVNGKSAPLAFDRATEWLRVALNPFEAGEKIPPAITARPRVISPAQFSDESLGKLDDYDC